MQLGYARGESVDQGPEVALVNQFELSEAGRTRIEEMIETNLTNPRVHLEPGEERHPTVPVEVQVMGEIEEGNDPVLRRIR